MSPFEYKPVIGLEIHAQLSTQSKLFCGCSRRCGSEPNSHTCPVCLGLPGSLPVLNQEAHRMAVRTALALNTRINHFSFFDRKNYFYPDLPKGYQITQQRIPVAFEGKLELMGSPSRSVRIERLHLEEDAGKSIHTRNEKGQNITLVDYNRSGIPLIEIVTHPDISSPAEAVSVLKQIRILLLYLDVCDGNMEAGSLRCDANLSLLPHKDSRTGVKSEIKNLNSFGFLRKALEHEIYRQTRILNKGGTLAQDTRFWNEKKQITRSMRDKEESRDYRFFPEPDIPALKTSPALIRRTAAGLPELPSARWNRYVQKMRLSPEAARTLVFHKDLADYFEKTASKSGKAAASAHWIIQEVLYTLKEKDISIKEFPIPPENMAELIQMMETGQLSKQAAKERIFPVMLKGRRAATITRNLGLEQISNDDRLEKFVREIIRSYPVQVHQYRKGKKQVLNFLIGKVMAKTRGRAEPEKTKRLFKRILDGYNKNS